MHAHSVVARWLVARCGASVSTASPRLLIPLRWRARVFRGVRWVAEQADADGVAFILKTLGARNERFCEP